MRGLVHGMAAGVSRGLPRRRGATLIELVTATVIFTVLGTTLLTALRVATGSRETVSAVISENETQREVGTLLMDELKMTSEALLTVTPMAGGNHQVDLQLPIDVGGVADWGVDGQSGWQVRYTVRALAGPPVNRQLVRQVLNVAGVVQSEEVMAEGLADGAEDPPGFQVTQVGAVWEVVLTTDSQGIRKGRRTRFHARPRN